MLIQDSNKTITMRIAFLYTFLLICLTACSDSDDNPTVASEPAFLSYKSEPQPRGGQCNDQVDVSAPLIVNGFGFNHDNSRNKASLIDSTNVDGLEVNFIYAPANATEKRGAPAVTAQAIFLTSGSELIAVNRLSGCRYWTFSLPEGNRMFRSGSILYVPEDKGFPATVYAGDSGGYVYAVEAVSGSLLWHRFVGNSPRYQYITGGMQHHGGRLFVPVSSNELLNNLFGQGACCVTHGMLVALEVETGNTLWEYHTTEEATEIVVPDNRVGPNGASIWSTPTLDIGRNTIYVGTGQNYTEPITRTSDAVISLDMDDGSVNWIFQATDTDAWNASCLFPGSMRCPDPAGHDFDFGAAPILVEARNTVIAGDGLLINSGYNTFQAFDGRRYQAGQGNALFVLRLPQEGTGY